MAQVAQHTAFQLVLAPRAWPDCNESFRDSDLLSGVATTQTLEIAVRAAHCLGSSEQ